MARRAAALSRSRASSSRPAPPLSPALVPRAAPTPGARASWAVAARSAGSGTPSRVGDDRPARTRIEPRLLRGSGSLVEIDAVAVAGLSAPARPRASGRTTGGAGSGLPSRVGDHRLTPGDDRTPAESCVSAFCPAPPGVRWLRARWRLPVVGAGVRPQVDAPSSYPAGVPGRRSTTAGRWRRPSPRSPSGSPRGARRRP